MRQQKTRIPKNVIYKNDWRLKKKEMCKYISQQGKEDINNKTNMKQLGLRFMIHKQKNVHTKKAHTKKARHF